MRRSRKLRLGAMLVLGVTAAVTFTAAASAGQIFRETFRAGLVQPAHLQFPFLGGADLSERGKISRSECSETVNRASQQVEPPSNQVVLAALGPNACPVRQPPAESNVPLRPEL